MKSGTAYLFIFALALIGFACGSAGGAGNAAIPIVTNGVMDLRGWDFSREGSVAVYGTWEFFWKKFIISGPPKEQVSASDGYIRVPSPWNRHRLPSGEGLPDRGFASYRVRILLPDRAEPLALQFNYTLSSYRAYAVIPGSPPQLIGRGGDPGRTEKDTLAVLRPTLATLPLCRDITLIFEVADYGSTIGGMWSAPNIGPAPMIYRSDKFAMVRSFLTMGCLLVIGLYSLVAFLLRRSDRAPLWLGLFCFIISGWTFLNGHYGEEWFPDLFSYSLVIHINFINMYLGFPIFFSFLSNAFSEYFPRKLLRALWAVCALFIGTVILLTPYLFFKFLIAFHAIVVVFSSVFIIYLVREGIRRRNALALISLAGTLVFFLAAVNDILVANYLLRTGFIMHEGFVFFILTQAFVMASQNAASRRRVEHLSGELRDKNIMLVDMNLNLEKKVEQRTGELVQAKDEIECAMEEVEAANESLIKTNADLEEAKRVMDMDMSMAINIQRTFLPGEAPRIRGWDIAYAYHAMAGVSGDFYDFFQDDGALKGAALFDVSGHGIASGLLTLMAKALVFRNFNQREDENLDSVMSAINAELIREIGSIDNYLTGIIIRVRGNEVEYVNAGHPPLMVKKGSDSSVRIHDFEDSESGGGYLGILELQTGYGVKKLKMEEGDALLLYSDCLTESFNANHESYTMERLKSAFRGAPAGSSSEEIIQFILEDFFRFAGKVLQDDLTMIVLRKT